MHAEQASCCCSQMIDEVHTLIGAGAAEGAIDAANILKPALARGELQCIGATTLDEYRKHIEKDPALERCARVDGYMCCHSNPPSPTQPPCQQTHAFRSVQVAQQCIDCVSKSASNAINRCPLRSSPGAASGPAPLTRV